MGIICKSERSQRESASDPMLIPCLGKYESKSTPRWFLEPLLRSSGPGQRWAGRRAVGLSGSAAPDWPAPAARPTDRAPARPATRARPRQIGGTDSRRTAKAVMKSRPSQEVLVGGAVLARPRGPRGPPGRETRLHAEPFRVRSSSMQIAPPWPASSRARSWGWPTSSRRREVAGGVSPSALCDTRHRRASHPTVPGGPRPVGLPARRALQIRGRCTTPRIWLARLAPGRSSGAPGPVGSGGVPRKQRDAETCPSCSLAASAPPTA